MTTTSWAHGVSGDYDTAGNWTAGVPVAGDTALITAHGTYTVTSSALNTLADLEMAKTTTLDIADHHMVITGGTGTGALAGTINIENDTALVIGTDGSPTTFDNTGAINLKPGTNPGDNAKFQVAGSVTLAGKGRINLSGNAAIIFASSTDTSTPTLTNGSSSSGNTIAGAGEIGNNDINFVNSAKGIIDANVSGNGVVLSIAAQSFTNSGLIEATDAGGLFFSSAISQTAKGQIKIEDGGAELDTCKITGGMVSIAKASSIISDLGNNEIDTTEAIENAGQIEVFSNLTITGAIKNTGPHNPNGTFASLLSVGGATLSIEGQASGGTANILDTSEIKFGGPTSTSVIFDPASTGTLDLLDATQFTGTVAGMSEATGASIDLENMLFGHAPVVSFNARTHLLTVTDPVNGLIDKIKIVGTGNFTAKAALDGTTLISDPAARAASGAANTPLITQSMASFGAGGGVATSGNGTTADHRHSSDLLSMPHHG